MATTSPRVAAGLLLDPVSRVSGGLSVRATVDVATGRVREAHALATMFRGYEPLLVGRDVRDAIYVASRACGTCGGAHATAAAMATEMAFQLPPPPMAIVVRNLLAALEQCYDLPLGLFVRSGPDWSEQVMLATHPALWQRAEATRAPRAATHGFTRIADIMTALTLRDGALYREALQMARTAGEAYVLLGGKYPHPQTLVPGGVSATVDMQDVNLVLYRVCKVLDYVHAMAAVWDDLVDFLLDADPFYQQLGAGPANFIDLGLWDDPFEYDGSRENSSQWGQSRWATPGAVIDGRLQSTSLADLDGGVEESVRHSFYGEWTTVGADGGRAGHPSGKQTLPEPGSPGRAGKYSWATAPRWLGNVMEASAAARLWTTALAGATPHRTFIEPTGHSLRLAMPRGALPATTLEWHAPASWGALERMRASAYALAFAGLVAYEHVVIALDLLRRGEVQISVPLRLDRGRVTGTGWWGSSRGYLSHHLAADRGVIGNYQILAGSTWSMSPRDGGGRPGICEQALVGAAVLPDSTGQAAINALRTIRSFDPCMACATT